MRFPAPIAAKAGPVPTHQRLGTDDRENLQDRRKPAIELNEEPAVVVREMSAALQLTPQDHQLMSERGILSLQPDLRLEWRGQDRQDKTQEPDRSASLGDSITSATRMEFSVHTTSTKRQGYWIRSCLCKNCIADRVAFGGCHDPPRGSRGERRAAVVLNAKRGTEAPRQCLSWVKLRSGDAFAEKSVRPLPAQPVDATQALNLSAGVSNCKVSRGRSFS